MLLEMLQGMGVFDKLMQGYYDESSSCGFVVECEETKDCLGRVCAPNRDAYGGTVYQSCLQACNENPKMKDFKEFACKNPEVASSLYGIDCEGYSAKGTINIFGRNISYLKLASFIILLIIIYIIVKRA